MFSYYLGIVIVALLVGGSVTLYISLVCEIARDIKYLATLKQSILRNEDPEKVLTLTKEDNKILGTIWIPKNKNFIA